MSSLLRSSISVNSTSPSTTSSTNWNETETLATIVFGIIAIFVSAATIWQGHRMWKVRGQRHPHSNPEDTIRSNATSVSVDVEAGLGPARTDLSLSSSATQTPTVEVQVLQQPPLESWKTEVVHKSETGSLLTSTIYWPPSMPPTARPSNGIVSSVSEEEQQICGRVIHPPPE